MRAKFIAVVSLNLTTSAAFAIDPAPQPVSQRFSNTDAGGDRAAPSTYQYDNGTVSNSWGAGVGEAFWMHRFTAVDGADWITSVSIAWGTITDGAPARIHIMQDPNSDGNPTDRVLLATNNMNVQSPGTGTFVVYHLPTPVLVSGDFYVGISVPTTANQFPIRSDTSTSITPGRAYFASHPVQVDPAAIPVQAWPANIGYFALRADGVKTGFTYQGRLTDSSGPYSGTGDVQATLYDAATGGSALGNTFTANGVSFDHGLFNIRIPAPASLFNTSDERWLEVAVRTPAGNGQYTVLSPRQRITQAPAALFAEAASSVPWTGITGVPSNITLSPWYSVPSGIATSAGRVGLGGVVPEAPLAIPAVNGIDLQSWHSASGTRRWNLNLDTFGTSIFPGLFFSEQGGGSSVLVLRDGGNIGIGTPMPSARLEVQTGAIGSGWQFKITNAPLVNFVFGARLADSGFVEMTNTAQLASPNFARLSSTGAWTAVSDARLKTDVTGAHGLLETALKLNPVNFRWKSNGSEGLGLIAQDARAILPTLVTGDESREMLTLDYNQLSVVTLGAIHELKADNDRKQRRIDELEARIAAIEAAMARPTTPTK